MPSPPRGVQVASPRRILASSSSDPASLGTPASETTAVTVKPLPSLPLEILRLIFAHSDVTRYEDEDVPRVDWLCRNWLQVVDEMVPRKPAMVQVGQSWLINCSDARRIPSTPLNPEQPGLYHQIRPILYRHVRLGNWESLDQFEELLETNPYLSFGQSLGQLVHSFDFRPLDDSPLADLDPSGKDRALPFDLIMRHCTALKRVTLNDYAMHTKYSWQAWHRALDKQAAVASPIESLCSTLSWTRDALKLMACLGSELRELVIKGWEVVGPWLAQEEEFYEILRLNAVMPSARTGLVTFGLRKISVITRCEVSQGLIQSLPILVPMLEELYLAEEVDIFAKNIMNRGNDLTFSGLISGLNADSMKSLEIYAHPTGRLSLGTFEGVAGHLPKLTRLGGCSHYFSYQILIDIAQHGSVSWLCTHPDRDSEGGNESEDDEDKRALFQEETLESRAAVQEMGTIAEEMISLGVAWADEEGGSKGAVINKLMRLVRGRAQRRGASKGR